MAARDADVIIAGGGPAGLMLANELGRRGIASLLLCDRPSTTNFPQANATQARSMEHYRRLGFVRRVREAGLPADYPTDVAYFTRIARHEQRSPQLPREINAPGLLAFWACEFALHPIAANPNESILIFLARSKLRVLKGIWRPSSQLAVKTQPTLSNANKHERCSWPFQFLPQWAIVCCPLPRCRFDLVQFDLAE